MADFASAFSLASTVLGAVGRQQAGAAADRAASFRADQLEQEAGQQRAAVQRAAIEDRRQAAIAASRVQALAGGGGLDPTVVKLQSDIVGQGEYRALTDLYGGEERARGLETSADAARYEGRMARRAGNLDAVRSIFSYGASPYGRAMGKQIQTMWEKYRGTNFPGANTYAANTAADQLDY